MTLQDDLDELSRAGCDLRDALWAVLRPPLERLLARLDALARRWL